MNEDDRLLFGPFWSRSLSLEREQHTFRCNETSLFKDVLCIKQPRLRPQDNLRFYIRLHFSGYWPDFLWTRLIRVTLTLLSPPVFDGADGLLAELGELGSVPVWCELSFVAETRDLILACRTLYPAIFVSGRNLCQPFVRISVCVCVCVLSNQLSSDLQLQAGVKFNGSFVAAVAFSSFLSFVTLLFAKQWHVALKLTAGFINDKHTEVLVGGEWLSRWT